MRPVISHTLLRSFGRVHGRKLSDALSRVVQDVLPSLLLPEHLEHPARAFNRAYSDIMMEIGFGSGEHLVHLAGLYPDTGFIGCEPYLNGVAAAAQSIHQAGLSNIRIFRGDARVLLRSFPPESLLKIFILFPDPWPKTKHHKKRLITGDFPDELARVLMSGGEVVLATDHDGYAGWMLSFMQRCSALRWQVTGKQDWCTPPVDWIPTRYQQKAAREGRDPMFLVFRKGE